jgi:NAD(P)-dependent dehydrogenase (short-subunit alcohol dehydrogenase family)
MEKVWLITGCSTGFGRELAKEVLAKGYKVAVASRKTSDVDDIVAAYPNTSIAIKLDVTIDAEIKSSVTETMAHFGQIDVLVNNAGIGYFGSIEESEEAEVRNQCVWFSKNDARSVTTYAQAKKWTYFKYCFYCRFKIIPWCRFLQRYKICSRWF